jgi:hypothetical protein
LIGITVYKHAYFPTLRVNDGEPLDVPRNVTSMPLKLVSPSSV